MEHLEAGQYVVSVHTDIEYLIVTVNWDSENQYVGERSDGERTPLRHEWVRLSTRAKKELRSENPVVVETEPREKYTTVKVKSQELVIGTYIDYGGDIYRINSKKRTWDGSIKLDLLNAFGSSRRPLFLTDNQKMTVLTKPYKEGIPVPPKPVPYKYWVGQRVGSANSVIDARRPQRGTGVAEYKIGEAWYYEGFVDKLVKEADQKVTLQPLGGGQYRVNGMNRSAVTGRYKTTPITATNVDEVVDSFDRRKTFANGGLTDQKPHYKYEIGQEFPSGYKIVERSHATAYDTNFYRVTWTENDDARSSQYSEDQVARYLDTKPVPKYLYKIGEQVGGVEIEARKFDLNSKPIYMVGDKWFSEEDVTEMIKPKAVPFVAKTLAVVTDVGVTTKIRHEDRNWMVKDVHLLVGEHTQKVQFGLALADEDHYEYKSVTFDEYDKVKVIA